MQILKIGTSCVGINGYETIIEKLFWARKVNLRNKCRIESVSLLKSEDVVSISESRGRDFYTVPDANYQRPGFGAHPSSAYSFHPLECRTTYSLTDVSESTC